MNAVPGLIWLDRAGSTQDEAHERAAGGAEHGTAIAAREQTQGRGQRGRAWDSGRGGLWLSVICRPRQLDSIECLSLRVGLAVADALDAAVPAARPLAIKWPNDLYVADRKVAGVLCEGRWHGDLLAWIVVGVGVNVRNTIPPDLQPRAMALSELEPAMTAEHLGPLLAAAIAVAGLRTGPLSTSEVAAFASRDWLCGRRLAAPEAGLADGIEAGGALRIRRPGGDIARLTSGTVLLDE